MDVVHPRCAGVDVSKRDAKVCVRVAGAGPGEGYVDGHQPDPGRYEALTGRFSDHHAFLARLHLDLIDGHSC